MIHLDFETWSVLDVRNVGAWKYSEHPSTYVLCLSYTLSDSGDVFLWHPNQVMYGDKYKQPELLAQAILKGEKVCAWNANFERAIFENVCQKMGWVVPKLSQYVDAMAIAAYYAYPLKLERAAKALKVKNLKRSGSALSLITKNPMRDAKVYQELYEYCIGDTKAERDILNALPAKSLPPKEQKIWEIDSVINRRGARVDIKMVKGAISISSVISKQLTEEIADLTHGWVTTLSQRDRILRYINALGYPLKGLTKEQVQEALNDDQLPELARRILEARFTLGQSSVTKYAKMDMCACEDGTLKGMTQYHVATTGRWGGRLVQLQNLKRPTIKNSRTYIPLIRNADVNAIQIFGDPFSILSSSIRHALIPRKGNRLIAADYTAIEARVLGWVSNDEFYLSAFRTGRDLYKVMAAAVYRMRYEDVGDESDERWLGKQLILGLGYQMGQDKLLRSVEKYVKLNKKLIADLRLGHTTYRKSCRGIVRYWSNCEKAMRAAILTKRPNKLGRVTFLADNNNAYIQLPSGRQLCYPEAEIRSTMTPWSDTPQPVISYMGENDKKQWVRQTTYSGKIVENIVQAISRDILAEAILRLENNGFPVVFHIHDEPVTDVPVSRINDEEMKLYKTCMTKKPSWADNNLFIECGIKVLTEYAK